MNRDQSTLFEIAGEAFREFLGNLNEQANRFVELNQIPDEYKNSVQHAYLSIQPGYRLGRTTATILGNIKEIPNRSNSGEADIENDEYKDQFNNEVGRRIADFIKEHDLHPSTGIELLNDAVHRGDILSSLEAGEAKANSTQPTWRGPSPETWAGITVTVHL